MNQSTQNKPNILLVDDRPENLLVLKEILGTTDQNLVMAKSGEEALKQILEKDFAAILLDVQMPGMNGFEATITIRELEKDTGKHVPIIAVTAHVMPGYKEECLKAGMDNYLAKPFRMQELFGIIEETLAQMKDHA